MYPILKALLKYFVSNTNNSSRRRYCMTSFTDCSKFHAKSFCHIRFRARVGNCFGLRITPWPQKLAEDRTF